MFSERQYLLRDGDTHIVSPSTMLGLSGFTPAILSLCDDHQYYVVRSQDTFTSKKLLLILFPVLK
jgi:hypothetical protein